MNNLTLLTLCEGPYHLGVAALINSAIRAGFQGRVRVHYRGTIPPWTVSLQRVGEGSFSVEGCTLDFRRSTERRHFSFHKPFAALEAFAADPDCDGVIYADPDVVFLAPWEFIGEWLEAGVALCLDSSFPFIFHRHPWREVWRRLISQTAGAEPIEDHAPIYANSGFFGVLRRDIEFLDRWVDLTRGFETQGGDTAKFCQEERHRAIICDQDLLAATLMLWPGEVSALGPEGMGFNDCFLVLVHDVESPKPWVRRFLMEALVGRKPTAGSSFYLKFCDAPIAGLAWWTVLRKKFSFRCAELITMVWKR